ncbi:MAG: Ig-like domain-containing protein [Eubacterium sp.]|nr:Ig-like domain-containing protein [Eubacterium sp.]
MLSQIINRKTKMYNVLFLLVLVMGFTFLKTDVALARDKKVVIKVGKTKKLHAFKNAKVKWKSRNPQIVSVSRKGQIKAKKKGTARVVAKIKNKERVFIVKVSNSYYKADYKMASRMVVRNLSNGKTKEFVGNDIQVFQDRINQCKFYRYYPSKKAAVGSLCYMFSLYDQNDKLVASISVGNKQIVINKDSSAVDYASGKTLELKEFKF